MVLFYQHNAFADRLREKGVTVLSYDRVRASERATNTTAGVVHRRLAQVGAVVRRFRLLRRERIDLLHLNNGPTIGVDDWLPAAMLARIPCVVNAMGLPVKDRRTLRRLLSRRFDRIIAISQYMQSTLRDDGFPVQSIATIPLSVDIEELRARVRASRDAVRATLAIPADAFVVTMVGNIRKWKGQHVLVEAVRDLPEDVRRRLVVLFVGDVSSTDRDYFAHLGETVAAAGLERTVKFLGARGDVPNLLASSDAAVHASILPEPFGLVVVEAMALGIPIVATRIGGPPEIVTPGSGLLFDPASPRELADCLTRLARDSDLRAAIGKAARIRADAFSLARHVDAMVELYDDITDRQRDARNSLSPNSASMSHV
jgi:glycosyltransferase involved in cell wall biosynthesis